MDVTGYRNLADEAGKRALNIDSVFDDKSNTNRMMKLIKKTSGKVKDIAIGKTKRGTLTRGLGLLQYLDWFDPTEATELPAADFVQGRDRSPENIKKIGLSYLNDLKSTGSTLAKTIPAITATSQLSALYAPAATSTAMGTAGAFALPLGAVMLFDSYDNIFHDGAVKDWFKENDPGQAISEGAKLTAKPGDFDYKNNDQGSYMGMRIPSIK